MPNRLLLADADPKTLRVLEVSLRNAGFQVSTAQSGPGAWDVIEREAPAVIIADPALPELDGLALCARVRERAPDRAVPFIFIGADKSVDARVRGLQAGADDYLVKPTYVNEVIARVRALMQRREREKLASTDAPPEAFHGNLADIAVVDLFELLAANRRSGIVHLRGPRGATATVYFRQGSVIDAEVGRLSGADAVGRLFAWTEGTFDVEWKNIRRPDAIGKPTADLVLEGMRRLEQKTSLGADGPQRDGVYEVNYRILAERLAEIPDEVNGILRLFDGSRRLAQVVEDSQISDAEAMTVITRLRDEGIILEVKPKNADPANDAVPRAVSGDRGSARNGGSGAERRSGRAPAASGPAGQSFADRMRAGGVAQAAADSGPPPPPPPTTTKTDRGFPQLDVLAASSADTERAALGPSRGEANLELLNGDGADAESQEAPPGRAPDDNVIPFPTEGRAPSSRQNVVAPAEDEAAAPPPASDEEMSPEELAALFGSTGIASPPEPVSESGVSSPESAVPKVPVSMLQTQRGFGLPPPPPKAAPDSDSPARDVALASASASIDASTLNAAPDPSNAANQVTVPTPAGADESPAPASSPTLVRTATGGGGVVTMSTVKEASAPYNDRDLSKNEALDELGVPRRKRAMKVLAIVLALGAVGAVVAKRFLVHPQPPVAERPVLPAPPSAVPVEASRSAEGAPAVAAGRANGASKEAPEAKNPGAARDGDKGIARATEEAPEKTADEAARPAVDKPAEKKAEKKAEKIAEARSEKAGDKTADESVDKKAGGRRSAEADKAPAPEGFRQQLADCHALFAKNRFREASTVCGAAVQSNPRSADALTMLAHVELNRGHMNRAYELAQKAISIYPDQADAYVIIGGVHQDGGRNAQAKAAYQRYLHLAPHGRYAVELRSIVGSL